MLYIYIYIYIYLYYIYIYIIITSNPWSHWKLSVFKNEIFTYELSNSCKHSIRIIGLSSIHLKRPCQVAIFLKKYQGIHACLVSDFHPRLWKCWLYAKFWIFISGWNFISGLPNWAEMSTWYMESKFLQVIAIYIF